VTKVVLLGLESVPLTSRFVDLTLRSDFVHLNRLLRSKMSFHQALDLIFELDETTVGCPLIVLRILWRFVTKLPTGRLIDGSSCGGIDMVIKDLDLEPKVDAIMRDFLE
ncbi:hypothetical protein Tco_0976167, partial [Tanacetum coccineum]